MIQANLAKRGQILFPSRGRLQSSPHEFDEGSEIFDKAGKFFRLKRLRSVGKSVDGVRMHLDHQAVCPCRNGGARHGLHKVPVAGGVAWIDDNGEMRLFFQHRDTADIERVAGGRFKGADASFTKDYLAVAFG